MKKWIQGLLVVVCLWHRLQLSCTRPIKRGRTSLACSILLHVSARRLFFLSIMLGQVNWRHILCACKYLKNSFDMYALPLFVRRHLILCPTSFSTLFFESLKLVLCLWFFFHKIYPNISWEIINKNDHVPISCDRWLLSFSKNTKVQELEWLLALECRLLIRKLMRLSILASLTNYVITVLKLWKTFHHRLLHHRL